MQARKSVSPTATRWGISPKANADVELNEIVEASGVNDVQEFVASTGITFREQAKWFLNHSVKRKRRPVKPATIQTWQNCTDKWLNPNLGDLLLGSINNATVKVVVAKMNEAGLSAKTICNYVGLVKLVLASAIDANGEQLYPAQMEP